MRTTADAELWSPRLAVRIGVSADNLTTYDSLGVAAGCSVKVMNHSISLPLEKQGGEPTNLPALCEHIERRLDHLSPDAEIIGQHGRRGLRISSSHVSNQDDLWKAVEPLLPPGVFGPQQIG
jgi:hypothetical protein